MFCLKTDIISREITTDSRKYHEIKKQEGKVSTIRKNIALLAINKM